jgi:hypothetical protein
MTVHHRLPNRAFDPATIAVMVAAFEEALRELRLTDGADPAAELVARKVIELTEWGERDPARLRDRVVRSLLKTTDLPRTPGCFDWRKVTLHAST